jgi:hypothetical protein
MDTPQAISQPDLQALSPQQGSGENEPPQRSRLPAQRILPASLDIHLTNQRRRFMDHWCRDAMRALIKPIMKTAKQFRSIERLF